MVGSQCSSQERKTDMNGNNPPHKTNMAQQPSTDTVSLPQSIREWGISEAISDIFQPFFESGKLKFSEFDARAIDAFKSLSVRDAEEISALFETSDLGHISNKSAHLCTSIRLVRDRRKNHVVVPSNEVYKPDEDKMNAILRRTGYPYERTSGQRKYGPPPTSTEVPAANGHEIYIGSIPYSVCEDTLIPLMEKCGTIYDLRMMVDAGTGRNKGFCFVTFVEEDAVEKAVKTYNGTELKPGMKIRVNPSIPNLKLSVAGLPLEKTIKELLEEFSSQLDGVVNVEAGSGGTWIVHFDRHKNASAGRRKLFTGRARPFDQLVQVDWYTVGEENAEEDIKVLFVRNIDPDMTDEEFSFIFSKFGTVMRINRFVNHLFVHYAVRSSAEKALSKMDRKFVGTREVEVSFARCQNKKDRRDKHQVRPTGVTPHFDGSMYFGGNGGAFYSMAPLIQPDGTLSSVPCYYYLPVDPCWMYENGGGVHPSMIGYEYYGMPHPFNYLIRPPEDSMGNGSADPTVPKTNGSACNGKQIDDSVDKLVEDVEKM